MKQVSIVYTNDRCIGCNKCIAVCSAIGACISRVDNGRAHIVVDGSKCVACGSCIDVCMHGAREYLDDTDRFFADLRRGEPISLLLAPSFKANYPDRYGAILGGLKALGVRRVISVSFGADITTWGYLNYMDKYDFAGGISQPCPAVVSYIERYLPELLPKLFPVQSPLMCAAIYARSELKITDRFAFISPCIAKKVEMEDPHNAGLVQYNVTFDHLIKYVEEHHIEGPSAHSEIEYGLGSFYPAPGGLTETVRWFLGDSVFIRQIEGERRMYEWMHANKDRIKNGETPFLFIDALNCEKGCVCGTAVEPAKAETDDALYALLKIREASKKQERGAAWSVPDSREERLRQYNKQFEHLRLEDYLRGYTDRSSGCSYEIPSEAQLDAIFRSMNKLDADSRRIDCTCCGYRTCTQMATAIHNGFNRKENCIHYEKDMVRRLEHKSSTDLLTGLLNKISFEESARSCIAEPSEDNTRALFILDFDNFKSVNDEHGHKTGDEVLKSFGKILRRCFRESDVIGRVGGDEFMVLASGSIPEASITERCERINDLLRRLTVGEASGFSCSIGVVIDSASSPFDELYRLADDALYEAKARGKARYVKWRSRPIAAPEKDVIFIATPNGAYSEQIRRLYGDGFLYLEAGEATAALNEISLYRRYVKRIFIDYTMPDITEAALKEYIRSRPLFGEIPVHDVNRPD